MGNGLRDHGDSIRFDYRSIDISSEDGIKIG